MEFFRLPVKDEVDKPDPHDAVSVLRANEKPSLQMFVWTLSPKAVFIYEIPKSLGCIL